MDNGPQNTVNSALAGTCVSSLYRLKDQNNTGIIQSSDDRTSNTAEAGFFVFGDLSVKKEGDFRLRFYLFEVRGYVFLGMNYPLTELQGTCPLPAVNHFRRIHGIQPEGLSGSRRFHFHVSVFCGSRSENQDQKSTEDTNVLDHVGKLLIFQETLTSAAQSFYGKRLAIRRP